MDFLLKKMQLGSFKYSLLVISILLSWMIGIAGMKSWMLEKSFTSELISISITIIILFGVILWMLSQVSKLNKPIVLTKKVVTIFLALNILSLGGSMLFCYNETKQIALDKANERKIIREKQEAYAKLSPEDKAKIKKDEDDKQKKLLQEQIESEKLNAMSASEKSEYLAEKEITSKMTQEEVEKYQQDKVKKKNEEAIQNFEYQLKVRMGGQFVKLLKQSMKSPKSFELQRVLLTDNGYYCITYEAKNAFNAELESSALFSSKGIVLLEEADGNKFSTNWNKHCTKSGEDITRQVRIAQIIY